MKDYTLYLINNGISGDKQLIIANYILNFNDGLIRTSQERLSSLITKNTNIDVSVWSVRKVISKLKGLNLLIRKGVKMIITNLEKISFSQKGPGTKPTLQKGPGTKPTLQKEPGTKPTLQKEPGIKTPEKNHSHNEVKKYVWLTMNIKNQELFTSLLPRITEKAKSEKHKESLINMITKHLNNLITDCYNYKKGEPMEKQQAFANYHIRLCLGTYKETGYYSNYILPFSNKKIYTPPKKKDSNNNLPQDRSTSISGLFNNLTNSFKSV
ncbi:hypothetical protein [Flammeovirga pacifica]|uniref:Uncharacterized protein n=1 Tax=Flammeovirga pacifica TaxID=915059 RepID=A0A1S1Z0M5_FLAPC|nr:hypothetical protein [Flammeovirga pacifica]OHX66733.1 hypothetical protein NH26_10370 [Flammeovirga pacifica]